MAVPALARFGSHELKTEFLVPSVAGDVVACLGVSEAGSGSDVASIKTTALPKKGTRRVRSHIQAALFQLLVWSHKAEPWFHSWYRGRVETLDAKYNLIFR